MKKFSCFSRVMVLIWFATTLHTYAQSFDKKNIALCYYTVLITDNLGINTSKQILDSSYLRINQFLLDSAKITVKPVNTLKGKVPYDFTGYPLATGKKAAKSEAAANYLKIIVNIKNAGIMSETSSSNSVVGVSWGKDKLNTKIKVSVEIIVFDKNGEKVADKEGEAVSAEKITIETKNFGIRGFKSYSYKPNAKKDETIELLLDQAAMKAIRQL